MTNDVVLLLSVLLSSLAAVCFATRPALGATRAKVVPVETPKVRAEWQVKDARGRLARVADEDLGMTVLEYREENPLSGVTLSIELDAADLAGTDTLRFQWKVAGDAARVQAIVHGHPYFPERKRYFLHKRPNPPGEWQEAFLDLRHDDDGGASDAPEGKTRLMFSMSLHDLGGLGANPVLAVRLADVRFECHPIRLAVDLEDVETIRSDRQVGQRYPLKVTNKTTEPQVVNLRVDRAGLERFGVTLAADRVELAPGETKTIEAEITVPADKAAELPPLTMESARVIATTEARPDWTTTWYKGYLVYSLIGAVPAKVPDKGAWLADAARDRPDPARRGLPPRQPELAGRQAVELAASVPGPGQVVSPEGDAAPDR